MQEKTINLGKLLVSELEQDQGTDFLSRWIAHYLAEQITLAENAKGHQRTAARKKCFETVLTLWKHRASFPNGRRPFEKFEPILRALGSLGLDNTQPYYHQLKATDKKTTSKESKLVSQLIEVIFAADAAARVVIDTALNELTSLASTPRTKAMLKNAPKAAKQDSINVVRILFAHTKRLESESDQRSSLIQARLKQLQNFSALCKILEAQLRKQLPPKTTMRADEDVAVRPKHLNR